MVGVHQGLQLVALVHQDHHLADVRQVAQLGLYLFGIDVLSGWSQQHALASPFDVYEAILIGVIGSAFGTIIGLLFSYWLQEKGIDISGMTQGATMMMPGKFHARIVPQAYYIGFIPGLFSSTLGTVLSGIGIYKRKTASLFKELET